MLEDYHWLSAIEVLNARGASPVVLLCPHASNYIPPEYNNLGLPASELERHIAWDIGAAGIVRRLCEILDAPAFLGAYSRLLIDLNRPLRSASSIVARSENVDIPGNLLLPADEIARRTERIFQPYHAAVKAHLTARALEQRPAVIVAIHSFTPSYQGIARRWHAGVLFEKSKEFGHATLQRLCLGDETLSVEANVPYTVTRDSDFALLVYGDDVGNPAIEFEVRQDLIAKSDGQQEWAKRIADSIDLDLALTVSQ